MRIGLGIQMGDRILLFSMALAVRTGSIMRSAVSLDEPDQAEPMTT